MMCLKSITYHRALSGDDNDNVDFAIELCDGRTFSFVAITPKNILKLLETEYADRKEWVEDHYVIVRNISEVCIQAAIERCIELGIERFGVEQRLE